MLKKIAITVSPIIVFLFIEILDDWSTWKTINLYYRKDLATAKIIKNPFYKLIESEKAIDKYGQIDYLYLFEYSYSNGYPYIVYEFVEGDGKRHIDSLNYKLYHGETGDNGEAVFDVLTYLYVNFAETLLDKPINSSFDVYYYKDLHIPKNVFIDLRKETGKTKVYLHDSGVKMFFLFLVFCVIIGLGQFNSGGKKRFKNGS